MTFSDPEAPMPTSTYVKKPPPTVPLVAPRTSKHRKNPLRSFVRDALNWTQAPLVLAVAPGSTAVPSVVELTNPNVSKLEFGDGAEPNASSNVLINVSISEDATLAWVRAAILVPAGTDIGNNKFVLMPIAKDPTTMSATKILSDAAAPKPISTDA
jgi:hypothetical protein